MLSPQLLEFKQLCERELRPNLGSIFRDEIERHLRETSDATQQSLATVIREIKDLRRAAFNAITQQLSATERELIQLNMVPNPAYNSVPLIQGDFEAVLIRRLRRAPKEDECTAVTPLAKQNVRFIAQYLLALQRIDNGIATQPNGQQ